MIRAGWLGTVSASLTVRTAEIFDAACETPQDRRETSSMVPVNHTRCCMEAEIIRMLPTALLFEIGTVVRITRDPA